MLSWVWFIFIGAVAGWIFDLFGVDTTSIQSKLLQHSNPFFNRRVSGE